MKNVSDYFPTSPFTTAENGLSLKTFQDFQERLWAIKESVHHHVESRTQLIYLDAIKDVLNTLAVLEKRLNVLRQQRNENFQEKDGTNLEFGIESMSRDIRLLQTTVHSIIQPKTG